MFPLSGIARQIPVILQLQPIKPEVNFSEESYRDVRTYSVVPGVG
jgi:hypothetical protein